MNIDKQIKYWADLVIKESQEDGVAVDGENMVSEGLWDFFKGIFNGKEKGNIEDTKLDMTAEINNYLSKARDFINDARRQRKWMDGQVKAGYAAEEIMKAWDSAESSRQRESIIKVAQTCAYLCYENNPSLCRAFGDSFSDSSIKSKIASRLKDSMKDSFLGKSGNYQPGKKHIPGNGHIYDPAYGGWTYDDGADVDESEEEGGENKKAEGTKGDSEEKDDSEKDDSSTDVNYNSFVKKLQGIKGDWKSDNFAKKAIDIWKKDSKSVEIEENVEVEAKICIPTQNEIGMGGSLYWPLQKDPSSIDRIFSNEAFIVNDTPIVISEINGNTYVIDGHHRWSQAFCIRPDVKLKAAKIIIKDEALKTPDEVLKFVQAAIMSDQGKLPIAKVKKGDINLLNLKKEENGKETLEKWIKDNGNSKSLEKLNGYINKNGKTSDDKESVNKNDTTDKEVNESEEDSAVSACVEYLWKNIKQLPDSAGPKNARDVMPQTDDSKKKHGNFDFIDADNVKDGGDKSNEQVSEGKRNFQSTAQSLLPKDKILKMARLSGHIYNFIRGIVEEDFDQEYTYEFAKDLYDEING